MSPEIKRQRAQLMAERCVSGEFGGSAYHATMSPTTARMGISRGAIERRMRQIDPSALADRTRVAAETAASVAAGHVIDVIFVERGGSASAKEEVAKVTRKLKGKAHNIRVHKQRLNYLIEPGEGAKATASLQAQLREHGVAEEKRVAKRRREDEETALVLADLQAQLEASEERADNAEAKADVLKTEARKKSDAL